MKPVSRLVDDASPEFAQSSTLLRELRNTQPTHPARLDTQWRDIERRARGTRPGILSHLAAGLASAAVASLAVWLVLSPSKPPPVSPPWVAINGARLSVDPVPLLDGQLRGTPSGSIARVRTRQGEVAWSQARFLLEATDTRTLLVVDEGEVEFRDGAVKHVVRAGQSLEVPPPALEVPPALLAVPEVASTHCTGAADRETCLRLASKGTDLAAQNALFELALYFRDERHTPDAALECWQQYRSRFPDGVFRAEAQASSVLVLAQLGRREEARAAAEIFARDFPEDPLAGAVRGLSAQFGAKR